MKQIVVYVHGKGGSAEEAEHYSTLFPDSEVLGFDYRAQTPWEAREEFPKFFDTVCRRSCQHPIRGFQLNTSGFSGDHTHIFT